MLTVILDFSFKYERQMALQAVGGESRQKYSDCSNGGKYGHQAYGVRLIRTYNNIDFRALF